MRHDTDVRELGHADEDTEAGTWKLRKQMKRLQSRVQLYGSPRSEQISSLRTDEIALKFKRLKPD